MSPDNYLLKDKAFIGTKALPNGAAPVYSDGFDLETPLVATNVRDALLAGMELLLTGPLMNTTEMPDGKTMIYDVQCDDDVAFGSPKTIAKEILKQTGAGGVGCALATARFRLPTDCQRYVRIVATGSGAGDATTAALTEEVVF